MVAAKPRKFAMKKFAFLALALVAPGAIGLAQTASPPGWPEVIGHLTEARTEATLCVQALKSIGDIMALLGPKSTASSPGL